MAAPGETIDTDHREIDALFGRVGDPDSDHRVELSELIARLAAHISVEHSVILPAVRRAGIADRRALSGLKRDYHRMGHLLTRIERRKINSPDLPDLVGQLQSEWRHHVDRQQVLRGLDEHLSREEQLDLADQLTRAEQVIHSHPHPHLLALGPLSRLTTRLAARFDRARDRTVPNIP